MPITDTPLRYPGGKTQLAPFVSDLLRANDLLQCVYSEPFAGGAGIACRLLLNGTIAEAWINDIDPAIYAFWHSVLNATDELCERIGAINGVPITSCQTGGCTMRADSNTHVQEKHYAI